jgi:hypothetical protein
VAGLGIAGPGGLLPEDFAVMGVDAEDEPLFPVFQGTGRLGSTARPVPSDPRNRDQFSASAAREIDIPTATIRSIARSWDRRMFLVPAKEKNAHRAGIATNAIIK